MIIFKDIDDKDCMILATKVAGITQTRLALVNQKKDYTDCCVIYTCDINPGSGLIVRGSLKQVMDKLYPTNNYIAPL